MQTNTVVNKKSSLDLSEVNIAIQNALKNITWTDEQVKEWKKNRKSSSIPTKK